MPGLLLLRHDTGTGIKAWELYITKGEQQDQYGTMRL